MVGSSTTGETVHSLLTGNALLGLPSNSHLIGKQRNTLVLNPFRVPFPFLPGLHVRVVTLGLGPRGYHNLTSPREKSSSTTGGIFGTWHFSREMRPKFIWGSPFGWVPGNGFGPLEFNVGVIGTPGAGFKALFERILNLFTVLLRVVWAFPFPWGLGPPQGLYLGGKTLPPFFHSRRHTKRTLFFSTLRRGGLSGSNTTL